MKKITGIGLLTIILVLALTGCNQLQPPEPSDETPSAVEGLKEPVADEVVYTNTKYGFTLTFPVTWKDYEVESKTTDLPPKVLESVVFKINNEEIFNISVYPKADWISLKSGAEGPLPGELDSNAEYMFTYSPNQGIRSEEAMAANNDIVEIIKTFVLK